MIPLLSEAREPAIQRRGAIGARQHFEEVQPGKLDGIQVNLEEVSQWLEFEFLRRLLKASEKSREFPVDFLNALHAAIIEWLLLAGRARRA